MIDPIVQAKLDKSHGKIINEALNYSRSDSQPSNSPRGLVGPSHWGAQSPSSGGGHSTVSGLGMLQFLGLALCFFYFGFVGVGVGLAAIMFWRYIGKIVLWGLFLIFVLGLGSAVLKDLEQRHGNRTSRQQVMNPDATVKVSPAVRTILAQRNLPRETVAGGGP